MEVINNKEVKEDMVKEDIEKEVICTKYEDLLPGDDLLDVLKKINLKE